MVQEIYDFHAKYSCTIYDNGMTAFNFLGIGEKMELEASIEPITPLPNVGTKANAWIEWNADNCLAEITATYSGIPLGKTGCTPRRVTGLERGTHTLDFVLTGIENNPKLGTPEISVYFNSGNGARIVNYAYDSQKEGNSWIGEKDPVKLLVSVE